MCRPYGDLSAEVHDPASDWKLRGLVLHIIEINTIMIFSCETWNAFAFTKHSLDGGISSRVICGESGPAHLVSDPLGQDAKLVPLYRLMARYADASARGEPIEVNSPKDASLVEPVLLSPPQTAAA